MMESITARAAQGAAAHGGSPAGTEPDRGERRAPPRDRGAARAETLAALRFWLGIAVVSAATVLADLSLAAGNAGPVLHLAVVLLAWWAAGPRQVAAVALWASALVLLGFGWRLGTPLPLAAVDHAVDHAIALLAIWGVAAALIAAKRGQASARRAHAALETRLAAQASALAATRAQAELANRSRSEFFAMMGHELRTPLNAIIGFSEIIKDEIFGPVGSARYREYMHDINNSGHHLLGLVNDLLDIARIEVGKTEFEDQVLAVPELVAASLAEVGAVAEAGGVALETEIPAELPCLRADPRKLRQMLGNLLSNAVKFTAPGGRVAVGAWSSPDAGFVLQITDSGIGMALKDIPVALAPFGQVKNALRQRHEGSGLGLPLTKALAELHAGSLDLQSEPGVGTTVTLRFPAERVVALPKVA
jgi:signal transduction histidine kinase